MIRLDSQRQLASEEPGFNKGHNVVLAFSSDLHAETKFLTAAGERGRMEQIEVTLAHLDETNNGIHGAKPRPHSEVPGIFLIHADDEIFVRDGNVGSLGSRFHLFEILQAFESLL